MLLEILFYYCLNWGKVCNMLLKAPYKSGIDIVLESGVILREAHIYCNIQNASLWVIMTILL